MTLGQIICCIHLRGCLRSFLTNTNTDPLLESKALTPVSNCRAQHNLSSVLMESAAIFINLDELYYQLLGSHAFGQHDRREIPYACVPHWRH